MLIESVGRVLPFTAAQIFDLAADIERYPDFLPWWISATITKREVDTCFVEQVLGRGPVRVRFTSQAVLLRPERVDISSSDLLFRQFTLRIRVVPNASAGCSLSISARVELSSFILQQLMQRVLPTSIDGIIGAFERRAHNLYDHRTPRPSASARGLRHDSG
ncbi:MAG: type II toxin-antitoxin system RatA family toxin [Steroidobacteraceae bacterium]|jgi:coenzyme Q-binding protein COQ10